jgi:hypothetical protein
MISTRRNYLTQKSPAPFIVVATGLAKTPGEPGVKVMIERSTIEETKDCVDQYISEGATSIEVFKSISRMVKK